MLLGLGFSLGHAATYNDNQICRVYVDLPTWDMTGIRYRSVPVPAGVDPKKIVGLNATIYSDPYPAGCTSGCKTRAFPFDRLKLREDETQEQYGTPGLGGNIYYAKDQGGVWNIVLDRGLDPQSFFHYAGQPVSSGETITFIDEILSRGVLEIEYIGTKAATGGQGDSTILIPYGGWSMGQDDPGTENMRRSQLDFGNSQYRARDILKFGAVIYANPDPVTGNFVVEKMDRLGGAKSGLRTTRGGSALGGDDGWGFGYVETHTGRGAQSGHYYFLPDAGYGGTAQNRGWMLLRYKGLKNGTAYNGTSASYVPYPYALKSKVMELGAWNMSATTSGHVDKTYSIASLGIDHRRIVNFQVTLLSDAIPNESGRQEVIPLRAVAFAAPAGYTATDKTGRPYNIDNSGLHIYEGNPSDLFLSNSRFWSTATANRGFLKVDYIAAQCADRTGSTPFPNFLQIGTANGEECGGGTGTQTASEQVVAGYGAGLAGTADHFSYLSRNETSANETFLARLENVEKTADAAQFGLTFRGGTGNNAPHATVAITPTQGIKALTRLTAGASTTTTAVTGIKTPIWVRLQKTGKVFFMDYKSDAATAWTSLGAVTMPAFPSSYSAGFVGANATGMHTLSTGSAGSVAYSYPSGYFKIKNRWLNTYMHTEAMNGSVQNGNLINSTETVAQWAIEAATDPGFVRIKNRSSGQYMHVENQTGKVQYGPLNTTWTSMQWALDLTSGYLRIRNRWNGQVIHTENNNGYAQTGTATAVPPTYLSSHWILEPQP
jgi:hypothetical protein